MADTTTKLPVTTEKAERSAAPASRYTLDDLRREVDRLFQDFGRTDWLRPIRSSAFEPMLHRYFTWNTPAVDMIEKDTAYEISAELAGVAPKDIDVSLKNGCVVIKGEKHEQKEEKAEGYHLKERQHGSFERSFALPEGVDTSAVEATFANGVLKVTLPKTAEAQKPARKVEVKAA